MVSPHQALDRLRSGNQRFTNQNSGRDIIAASASDRLGQVAGSQAPFAVILGCADSRVPPEIVFDQGLGDLFVVRVAGNIATAAEIGSIEFAVSKFATPLVVVLGHTSCGAIAATIEHTASPGNRLSKGLESIVDQISPVVAELRNESGEDDLMSRTVDANVEATVERLTTESEIIRDLCATEKLLVTGARYDLQSGRVDFL